MMRFRSNSDVSTFGNVTELYDESIYGMSEPGTPRQELNENFTNTDDRPLPDQSVLDSVDTSKISDDRSMNLPNDGRRKEVRYETGAGNLPALDRRFSADSVESYLSSQAGADSNFAAITLEGDRFDRATRADALPVQLEGVSTSELGLPRDVFVVLPTYERQKLSRVLATLQQRLFSAKTDMEDLVARLNQELAVRQYLTMKVNLFKSVVNFLYIRVIK